MQIVGVKVHDNQSSHCGMKCGLSISNSFVHKPAECCKGAGRDRKMHKARQQAFSGYHCILKCILLKVNKGMYMTFAVQLQPLSYTDV